MSKCQTTIGQKTANNPKKLFRVKFAQSFLVCWTVSALYTIVTIHYCKPSLQKGNKFTPKYLYRIDSRDSLLVHRRVSSQFAISLSTCGSSLKHVMNSKEQHFLFYARSSFDGFSKHLLNHFFSSQLSCHCSH
jgi:hypothetical protein